MELQTWQASGCVHKQLVANQLEVPVTYRAPNPSVFRSACTGDFLVKRFSVLLRTEQLFRKITLEKSLQ